MFYVFVQTFITYAIAILPWFFIGSILAYIIESRIPSKKIILLLGKFRLSEIILSIIIGMISPLSIMSFLPVAQSLMKKGVHPSLLYSFLLSERSFDLQSFFIIASFFGLKLATGVTFIIFLSLLIATISIRNDTIIFQKRKKNTNTPFLNRQLRLFFIVIAGISISAACKAYLPQQLFSTYAHTSTGGVISALMFGFIFYLGPVITNYPVAKTFSDLGMSIVGVFSYLTISPILNGVIFVMFSNIAGSRITLKFITVYTISGLLLMWLLLPVFIH